MSDNSDKRYEVHISRKTSTTSSATEIGISLMSPSENTEELLKKAKEYLDGSK